MYYYDNRAITTITTAGNKQKRTLVLSPDPHLPRYVPVVTAFSHLRQILTDDPDHKKSKLL